MSNLLLLLDDRGSCWCRSCCLDGLAGQWFRLFIRLGQSATPVQEKTFLKKKKRRESLYPGIDPLFSTGRKLDTAANGRTGRTMRKRRGDPNLAPSTRSQWSRREAGQQKRLGRAKRHPHHHHPAGEGSPPFHIPKRKKLTWKRRAQSCSPLGPRHPGRPCGGAGKCPVR